LENIPTGKTPVLILDFLATFYDENVKMHTRKFLLESSLKHFQRLSQSAGLAVTVHAPLVSGDASYLFQRLRSAAQDVFVHETTIPDAEQLKLF